MASFNVRLCSAAETSDTLVVRKLLRRIPNINANSCGREMHAHGALAKAAKSSSFSLFMPVLEITAVN